MEDISSYFTLILQDEDNDSVIVEIENYNPYHIQASIENEQLYIVPALNWFGGTLLTISAYDGYSKIFKNIYLEVFL